MQTQTTTQPAMTLQPAPPETGTRAPARLESLDGLRGVAALVVLVCHLLLTVPQLGALAFHSGTPSAGTWEWWLVETPLHVAWEGTGAVYVFFVLSGFVLALPFTRDAGPRGWAQWRAYYPKRLARLYLPVWGAVAFAALVWALIPRPETGSGWVDAMGAPVTWGRIAGDLTLLFTDGLVVPPLWSLRWEMWFSLLLPLYVALGIVLPARLRAPAWAPWLVVAALLALAAPSNDGVARCLPLFMLGVLLAAQQERLAVLAARVPAPAWPLVLAGGLAAMWLPWMWDPHASPSHLARAVGAVVLVVVAVHWAPAVRGLSGRLAGWLGTVSFSLYLTHEPIVVAAYHVAGPGGTLERAGIPAGLWLSVPLGLAGSLAMAAVFHRAVERPSHRIAQWLGRRFR
ncbi:acyltransferase [Sinomonas halotolerans]|uniref:Acyltransferase n=1 Tax=Sinomonas halotolerans TaxID=1644133 RepID=A0ABU9WV17_9MICC